MERTYGRLRATLAAGKILVTDEACKTLHAGLNGIGVGYRIEKAISTAKKDTELKRELSRLHTACQTVVDTLDADLRGLCQIEVMLAAP